MINTKFKYYKTVKWKDLVFYFSNDSYKHTSTIYNKSKKHKCYKLTDKLVMRKLVKQYRKDNKLGNELKIISSKEQYWY